MTNRGLSGRAAIAGIGQTEFSKESGRTELQLACESVLAALDDAGLQASDVDGLVTFTMDTSEEMEIGRNLGIGDLSMFTRVPYGGGAAAGTVMQAAMAVAAGVADVVVCYRAFNERSGNRFGTATARVTELPLWFVVVRTVRFDDAGRVGCVARAALHGDIRRHERRLRTHCGRRPQARGDESERVVLRAADHARRSPSVAVDRRARAAPARLLPGKRRRGRAGRDVNRTGARSRGSRPRSSLPPRRAPRPTAR